MRLKAKNKTMKRRVIIIRSLVSAVDGPLFSSHHPPPRSMSSSNPSEPSYPPIIHPLTLRRGTHPIFSTRYTNFDCFMFLFASQKCLKGFIRPVIHARCLFWFLRIESETKELIPAVIKNRYGITYAQGTRLAGLSLWRPMTRHSIRGLQPILRLWLPPVPACPAHNGESSRSRRDFS